MHLHRLFLLGLSPGFKMALSRCSPSHSSSLFHGEHLHKFLSGQTLKVKGNPNATWTLLCSGKPISYLQDFLDRTWLPLISAVLAAGNTGQALQLAWRSPFCLLKKQKNKIQLSKFERSYNFTQQYGLGSIPSSRWKGAPRSCTNWQTFIGRRGCEQGTHISKKWAGCGGPLSFRERLGCVKEFTSWVLTTWFLMGWFVSSSGWDWNCN